MRVQALFPLLFLLLPSCTTEPERVSGNSTSTGNHQAAGRMVGPDGSPVEGVWIQCAPDSLPPWEPRPSGWTALTDRNGDFRCSDLPSGPTGITALDPASGLSNWREVFLGSEPTTTSAADTLDESGSLLVALPPGLTGILHFSGLTRTVSVRGESELEVREMPSGWSGRISFARSFASSRILDSNLRILPGRTDSAGFTRQSVRIRILLAGRTSGPLIQFPLLVRLDSSWPGFSTALPGGTDLRLQKPSGEDLPLEIATWNSSERTASLWTVLDSIPTPADSLDLVLSWGIPVPPAPVRPFTAARGWLAAWPLGDTGTTVLDRTGAHPGVPSSLASIPGIIGKASRFDGRLGKIVIPGSSATLSLPPGAPYTYSCWTRLARYSSSRFLMGFGDFGGHIKYQQAFSGDSNSWFAKDVRNSPSGGFYTLGHADTAVWTHLALTVQGDSIALFIGGVRRNLASGFDQSPVGRRAVDFVLGAGMDTLGATDRHYQGDIAEAWVQSVARSPDWIRAAAANQSPSAAPARVRP